MTNPTLERALHDQLDQLPLEQQRQVLEFARALAAAHVRGVPGHTLLRFAGTIEAADLAVMSKAIESSCEKVDPNEW
jgi:hypothetical protein